jgi:hypothetical protein
LDFFDEVGVASSAHYFPSACTEGEAGVSKSGVPGLPECKVWCEGEGIDYSEIGCGFAELHEPEATRFEVGEVMLGVEEWNRVRGPASR